MKLTFGEKFKKFFGYGYVMNLNGNEIHRLETKHKNCHTDIMTNKKYISKKKAIKLINDSKNDGCRFCWKEKDNG